MNRKGLKRKRSWYICRYCLGFCLQ